MSQGHSEHTSGLTDVSDPNHYRAQIEAWIDGRYEGRDLLENEIWLKTAQWIRQHQELIGSTIEHISASVQHQEKPALLGWLADQKDKYSAGHLLQQWGIETPQGLALMMLAEALMRLPDNEAVLDFLRDVLPHAAQKEQPGEQDARGLSESPQYEQQQQAPAALDDVKKVSMGLMRWGTRMLEKSNIKGQQGSAEQTSTTFWNRFSAWAGQVSDTVMVASVQKALEHLALDFISAQSVQELSVLAAGKVLHSFDMLGEGALSEHECEQYLHAYLDCAQVLSARAQEQGGYQVPFFVHQGMSVKLSALCARFDVYDQEAACALAAARLERIAKVCAAGNVMLTVDAEELYRLQMSLSVIEKVFKTLPVEYEGFGLAVQSNCKTALAILDWVQSVCQKHGKKMAVRLVKGAYWDYEVKNSISAGYDSIVWEHKAYTDQNYLVCAQKMLHMKCIYPMFATHNANTCATVYQMAHALHLGKDDYEFQKLKGMGDAVYVNAQKHLGVRVRIYAPVGKVQTLLPYLARRMMENGAPTSMLRQAAHDVQALMQNPFEVDVDTCAPTPVPHWSSWYQSDAVYGARKISAGRPLWMQKHREYWRYAALDMALKIKADGTSSGVIFGTNLDDLAQHIEQTMQRREQSGMHDELPCLWTVEQALRVPQLGGLMAQGYQWVMSNSEPDKVIGLVKYSTVGEAHERLAALQRSHAQRSLVPDAVAGRLECLSQLLVRFERHIVGLITLESGKCIEDAHNEWREAYDFCQFHANEARRMGQKVHSVKFPGEQNYVQHVPRGVALCVSPWNFSFAILMGQVTGALAGCCPVLVKGASSTSLTTQLLMQLIWKSGFSQNECTHVVISGANMQQVLQNSAIKTFAFTGSTDVARSCADTLLKTHGLGVRVCAETGGFNVMLIEASAHIHTAVQDVMQSAFNMAGQRCSALRCVWIDKRIEKPFMQLLSAAMALRRVQNPLHDVCAQFGPLIDAKARHSADEALLQLLERGAQLVARMPMGQQLEQQVQKELLHVKNNAYFAPTVVRVDKKSLWMYEVFAPLLQVYVYEDLSELELLKDAEQTQGGYGLTFGVQTRRPQVVAWCAKWIPAGNIYINRSMIGALVGVQPFGGMGASGTGPKIGGRSYVATFMDEQTVSINTSSWGGCIDLLSPNVRYLHDEQGLKNPWTGKGED